MLIHLLFLVMKRLTMKQIAEELGISRTTVSLVLKGKGDQYRISSETQKRILSYAQRVGFRPDYFASALNSRQTGVIGAVFPDVFETFMGSIIRGIESVLYEKGYSLMISTSSFSQSREQSNMEDIVYRGAEGLILVPTMPFHDEPAYQASFIETLAERNFPLILVDRHIRGLQIPCVLQRDYQRAYEAAYSFIQGGAKNIYCVSFYLQATSIEERLRGYADALKEQSMVPRYMLLKQKNSESRDLQSMLSRHLASSAPPDAFLVTTSGIADKLSWLLRTEGLNIPVARFGKTSPWTHQELIDIPQPHTQMGVKAAELLLARIDGKPVNVTTYC